ncbi:hypothetical protein DFS34DRAFT_646612 [Phlyctochytrium arcticum]|nr:hypothetical protein DFS34DRAFT_646612 [Phlyctochytrium arcticum]
MAPTNPLPSLRLLFIPFFLIHIPFTVLLTTQSLFPNIPWPALQRSILPTWIDMSADPFLAPLLVKSNSSGFTSGLAPWFWALLVCELVQPLLETVLLSAFVRGRYTPRVRDVGLIYAANIMTTMLPILAELANMYLQPRGSLKKYPGTELQFWTCLSAYIPFVILPGILGWVFWSKPAVAVGGEVYAKTKRR